jgi:hypothetical protein
VIGVNTFSGAHNNGNGIQIVGTSSAALTGPTTAEVIGNAITATATPTNQQTGITIIDGGSFSLDDTVPGTGATLARNRIIGGETGIQVVGNRTPVTLDGDVIARTAFTALQESTGVVDPITGGLGGDVSMSNVDIVNNANLGAELGQGVHLAIDSSIVRDVLLVDPMQAGNPDPTATCTITFSNGPSAAGECATFQSNAVPVFANAGADDYHLAAPPSNPELIDHGNSSPPPPGAIDPDRNPRAIDAVGLCPLTPIRDIGADEFNPGIPSCPSPSGGGPGTIAGPTGQRAAALKKCKRKHGKARKRCKRRAKKLPV